MEVQMVAPVRQWRLLAELLPMEAGVEAGVDKQLLAVQVAVHSLAVQVEREPLIPIPLLMERLARMDMQVAAAVDVKVRAARVTLARAAMARLQFGASLKKG